MHIWCGGHFTSIYACGVWEKSDRVQVLRRELHTHIHLDYVRVEIISCIKKKTQKKNWKKSVISGFYVTDQFFEFFLITG